MLRGRYSPFNLAAFNARLDHGLLLGLADNDHGDIYYTEDEIDALIAAVDLDAVLTSGDTSATQNIVLTAGDITLTAGSLNIGLGTSFIGRGGPNNKRIKLSCGDTGTIMFSDCNVLFFEDGADPVIFDFFDGDREFRFAASGGGTTDVYIQNDLSIGGNFTNSTLIISGHNIAYNGIESSANEDGINILSTAQAGATRYAGDINIGTVSDWGGGDSYFFAQTGGAESATGKVYIIAKASATNPGQDLHFYSEVFNGVTGDLYLQEQDGSVVVGDPSPHASVKLYVQGNEGDSITLSPSVVQFLGGTARDGSGVAGSDGGDTIIEATHGGDCILGDFDGGDGADLIFNAGDGGAGNGTGASGDDGRILLNNDTIVHASYSLTTENIQLGTTGKIYTGSSTASIGGGGDDTTRLQFDGGTSGVVQLENVDQLFFKAATAVDFETWDAATLYSFVANGGGTASVYIQNDFEVDGKITQNSLTQIFSGTKVLVDGSVTGMFEVAIGTGELVGGNIIYTIKVDNGTDLQCHMGGVGLVGVNKAGTVTCDVDETYTPSTEIEVKTAGTLTDTFDCTAGTGKMTVNCNAATNLGGTPVITIEYTITLHSLNTITSL